MNRFLALSLKERRTACEQAGAVTGLPAVSVEKDFWVCWALRELFSLPGYAEGLTFKGGTSLSKGWGLIRRFSEDVDLVIDRRGWDAGRTVPRKPRTAARNANGAFNAWPMPPGPRCRNPFCRCSTAVLRRSYRSPSLGPWRRTPLCPMGRRCSSGIQAPGKPRSMSCPWCAWSLGRVLTRNQPETLWSDPIFSRHCPQCSQNAGFLLGQFFRSAPSGKRCP